MPEATLQVPAALLSAHPWIQQSPSASLHTSLLLLMWPVLWPAHPQAGSPPAEVPPYKQDRSQSGTWGMIQAGDVAVSLARSVEDTGPS